LRPGGLARKNLLAFSFRFETWRLGGLAAWREKTFWPLAFAFRPGGLAALRLCEKKSFGF